MASQVFMGGDRPEGVRACGVVRRDLWEAAAGRGAERDQETIVAKA